MIKHIPSTPAEAGKVVIIRINGLVRIITTVNGLASQRSPGLPNGLVNDSKEMVSPIHLSGLVNTRTQQLLPIACLMT